MGETVSRIGLKADYSLGLHESNPCADDGHPNARMIGYDGGIGRYICRACGSLFSREPSEIELTEYRGRTRRLER